MSNLSSGRTPGLKLTLATTFCRHIYHFNCLSVCVHVCRRLAKSTLLLIPLFGINYVVFVYMTEPLNGNLNYVKIFFDLGLGSFQVTPALCECVNRRFNLSISLHLICFSGINCRRPVLFPQQRGESTHISKHISLTFLSFFLTNSFLPKVQSELRRMWRGLSLKRYVGRDYKVHAMSADRVSTETSAQFPRNFRAQSILQTETSVL